MNWTLTRLPNALCTVAQGGSLTRRFVARFENVSATAHCYLLIRQDEGGIDEFLADWRLEVGSSGVVPLSFQDLIPAPNQLDATELRRWRHANWDATGDVADLAVISSDDGAVLVHFRAENDGSRPAIAALGRRYPHLTLIHFVTFGILDAFGQAQIFRGGRELARLPGSEPNTLGEALLMGSEAPSSVCEAILDHYAPAPENKI